MTHLLCDATQLLFLLNEYAMIGQFMPVHTFSVRRPHFVWVVFVCLCLSATVCKAHPLDEMGAKANVYNPLAPKALDTLVDMRDGKKVLMGFFVDLSALVKADDFPEEFESVVTAGKRIRTGHRF